MSTPPPTPPGMTRAAFGKALWGTGSDEARRRLETITREELDALGMTCQLAEQWHDFYREQSIRRRGLPTAEIRKDGGALGFEDTLTA